VARDPRSRDLLGFAAMNATNPGWFGPMGVRETGRGRGMGTLLVRHCLAAYQRHGGRRVAFPWINENLPFYQRIVPSGRPLRFAKYEKRAGAGSAVQAQSAVEGRSSSPSSGKSRFG
jgi:hypothetical protein